MFVIDAFIGNNDRNNGNWGIIYQQDGGRVLSPVYDNGNCFRNKASESQLLKTLHNPEALVSSAYENQQSIFTTNEGRFINPFKYIQGMKKKIKKVLDKR